MPEHLSQCRFLRLAWLCVGLMGSAVSSAAPIFRIDGERLEVHARTYRAVLDRGILVSLKPLPVGEELLGPAGAVPVDLVSASDNPVEDGTTATTEMTATGAVVTRRNARGVWRLQVRVDESTDDLVLRVDVIEAVDLRSASVAMSGPDWGRLRMATPRSAQGSLLDEPPAAPTTYRYCGHRDWEVPLVLFEPRDGDGDGFAVWSQDPRFLGKSLRVIPADVGSSVVFETESIGSGTGVTSMTTAEWRVNVFRGDWQPLAGRYRDWMVSSFRPSGWSPPAWVDRIRCFVKITSLDASVLGPLAAAVEPAATLLVLPNWRQSGYDQNYPDYTARAECAPFIAAAHRLGFRVMVHFSTYGWSPGRPDFADVEASIIHRRDGAVSGWMLDDPTHPMYHFNINPARRAYRRTVVAAARNAVQSLGIDALHLDVSMLLENVPEGEVEGMTMGEGKQAFFQELARALPGVAFGGEELNESCMGIFSFTQRTPHYDENLLPHPLDLALFGPFVRYYSHYARTLAATASNAVIADHVRAEERSGIYPTVAIGTVADLQRSGARTVFQIARQFQTLALSPAWDRSWPKDTRFCWADRNGTLWPTRRTDWGAALETAEERMYARRSGMSSITTQDMIPGWPAFDGETLSGLDPRQTYLLVSGNREARIPRFLRIPDERILHQWSLSDDLVWATFEPNPVALAFADITALPGRVGIRLPDGSEEPLGRGALWEHQLVESGGERRSGFFTHPPWRGLAGPGQVFAEYELALPGTEPGLILEWQAGLFDAAQDSDGVTHIVSVDGKIVFQQHIARKGWTPCRVDLSKFRGTTIVLRLTADPGPDGHTSWDGSGWADPIVRRRAGQASIDLLLSRPARWAITASGRPLDIRAGDLSQRLLLAPGESFLVCCGPQPATPELPLDVFAWNPEIGQMSSGPWQHIPPESGIGARGDRSCAGVVRVASINAHPPSFGETTFRWLATLPNQVAALELGYGICGAHSGGVGFSVRMNRQVVWQDIMPTAGEHRTARVDIREYADREVLLELVTDSQGPADFDWAIWTHAELK